MAKKERSFQEEITFPEEDYKGMIFNIHAIPSNGSIFDIAILKSYPHFKKKLSSLPSKESHEKALSYMFYVYDPESPYSKTYEDIIKRKAIVAEEIFGIKEGEFDDYVIKIIENRDHEFNNLVVFFCVNLVSKSKYYAFVAYTERYWSNLEDLRRGKSVSLKDMTDLEKTIKRLKGEIFALDDDVRLEEEIYKHIKAVDLKMRPEDIAEMFTGYDEVIEVLENGK